MMAGELVVAPLVAALATVVLTLALGRAPALQRAVSVLGAVGFAAAVGLLTWRAVLAPGAPGSLAYQVGNVAAPYGITLVVDALSAFLLCVAAAVAVVAVAFAVRFVDRPNQRVFYHPLFHSMLVGVAGALLAGDLFNLFVWFEVMLMASYVFVAFYGGAQHTAAAVRYLVLNVIGSVSFLLGVGGIYATTGTLNMADLARRLQVPGAYGIDVAPVLGLVGLLFVAFALKSGLVPFQFWVPDAYRAAPLPAVAMLAGVTKKVGIYAIVRLWFTVLGGAALSEKVWLPVDSPLVLLGAGLLVMGVASIGVGAVGAVARNSIEVVLAYSSIGQVGFIAVGVAVAAMTTGDLRVLALTAALVYALHHALAKSLLFLAAATVRDVTGTNRFAAIGGLASKSPGLGAAVFVGGLALVGIPPLTGFFGKFLLFDATVRATATLPTWVGVGALLALLTGSVLTIVYVTRLWTACFWGAQTEAVRTDAVDRGQVALLVALAAAIVLVGVGFEPVVEFAGAAAEAATDTDAYVDAVLGGEGS
ncbi:complex I subunit 5 family protein [Halobacteriales archaeon Cl-PHB]